jgi:hypothetical protein
MLKVALNTINQTNKPSRRIEKLHCIIISSTTDQTQTRWIVSKCSLIIPPLFGKQEVGIWWVQKHFPRYGVHIWSLWPNIRSQPSIVAEKNVTKNGHIQNVCSMCIKINKWETFLDPSDSYSCLPTLLIFIHIEHTFCICPFFVTFFSATIDGRNLIFGHKLHIGTNQ